MKTVFSSHAMTAHVWAQNSQESGRSSDGRMLFQGRTIFSYGTHFALGHILESGAVLLNRDGYSTSTGKHKSHTSSAVRHLESYTVPGLTRLAHSLTYGSNTAATLADYVTAHALALDPGAGAYLLRLAGSRAPESRFTAIRAKAERARDKAAAKEARRTLLGKIADAKNLAALSPDNFAAWLARFDSPHSCEAALKRWRGIARAAARHISARTKATVKARVAALAALAARLAWVAARGSRLRAWIDYKTTLRDSTRPALERAIAARLLIENGRGLVNVAALAAFGESMEQAAREAAAKAARERMEREAAARAAWLAGESSYAIGRMSDASGGALLRAVRVERDESGAITAGELQTSWGATVPLTHAVRAFRFLKLCHATGRTWNANGRTIPVGHFRISQVTPESFVAGCHTVFWSEVSRLAGVLGLADLSGDESALVDSHAARAA